jgi:hypothetical protein
MKARLLFRERVVYPDGSVAEMVVWHLPKPVPPSSHPFKYRLAYSVGGRRVLGDDNERGKGDHRHRNERKTAFVFTSVEDLLARFVSEVEAMRSQK